MIILCFSLSIATAVDGVYSGSMTMFKVFTWLYDVTVVTSQSLKSSSHSETRTRINYPCGHFPQNVPVKKFSKSVNIWRRYGEKFVVYILGPPYMSFCRTDWWLRLCRLMNLLWKRVVRRRVKPRNRIYKAYTIKRIVKLLKNTNRSWSFIACIFVWKCFYAFLFYLVFLVCAFVTLIKITYIVKN